MNDEEMTMTMGDAIDLLQRCVDATYDITYRRVTPLTITRAMYASCCTYRGKVAVMTVCTLTNWHVWFNGTIKMVDTPYLDDCMDHWRRIRRKLRKKRQFYLSVTNDHDPVEKLGVW